MAAAQGCDMIDVLPVASGMLIAPKRSLRPAMTPSGSFGSVCTSARAARSTTLTAGKRTRWNWKGWWLASSSCGTQSDVPVGRPRERLEREGRPARLRVVALHAAGTRAGCRRRGTPWSAGAYTPSSGSDGHDAVDAVRDRELAAQAATRRAPRAAAPPARCDRARRASGRRPRSRRRPPATRRASAGPTRPTPRRAGASRARCVRRTWPEVASTSDTVAPGAVDRGEPREVRAERDRRDVLCRRAPRAPPPACRCPRTRSSPRRRSPSRRRRAGGRRPPGTTPRRRAPSSAMGAGGADSSGGGPASAVDACVVPADVGSRRGCCRCCRRRSRGRTPASDRDESRAALRRCVLRSRAWSARSA